MAEYVLTNAVPISYSLKSALITEVLFSYDNAEVNLRWVQKRANGTREKSKITTLSGPDIALYRTEVLARITAGESIDDAMRNAGYVSLITKESFPTGAIT